MNDPLVDPEDFESQLLARRVRVAPVYLAVTTAMVALWIYLVMGEFVLAGVPEWLGWATVSVTVGGCFWAHERRLSIYMTSNTLGHRVVAIVVMGLLILAALITAVLLGLLLPEPVVTVILLVLVGIAAWWKRGVRLRLYARLWQDEGWRQFGKVAFLGGLTILALGALIGRN